MAYQASSIKGRVAVEASETGPRIQRTIYQFREGAREVHTRYRYHKEGDLTGRLRHFTLTTSDVSDGSVAKKSFKYEYDDQQRVVRLVERKKTTLFGQLSHVKNRDHLFELVIANKSRAGQKQAVKAIVRFKRPHGGKISITIYHQQLVGDTILTPSQVIDKRLPPVQKILPVYAQNGDASLLRRIFSAADEDIVASERGTEISYFGRFDSADHPTWAVTTDEEGEVGSERRMVKSLVLFLSLIHI